MANLNNIFKPPVAAGNSEHFDILAQGEAVRIERIFSTGQATPEGEWFDQDSDEWVALLQGEADLLFSDGSTRHLVAGDHLFIRAHHKHRVESTSVSPPCVWLAIHVGAGMIQPATT